MKNYLKPGFALVFLISNMLLLSACGMTLFSNNKVVETNDKSQLQMRSIQSRSFDTNDKNFVLRSVIATLQDLGFVIDKADNNLGVVTATKLDSRLVTFESAVKITVSVRAHNSSQLLVRANAQYNVTEIDDAQFYQKFFTSLGKSMFLEANNIN